MIAPEQMARMNAKGSSWSVAPGGAPAWTPEEIAAVLAGTWWDGKGEKPKPLDRASLEIAYASICGLDASRKWVKGWLLGVVKALEYDEGWNETHERHVALAALCFGKVLPKPCSECRGRAWLPNVRGIPEPCAACAGEGRRAKTAEEKGEMLGCSERTWFRVWRKRESKVLHEYTWRESRVHNRLMGAKKI